MLPSFQVQAKNISPDKQMALIKQYLNQLKDETETELYDIKWDNLSKPLRDKLNSLESYSAETQQQINQINANVVKADSIETLVLQAGFIKADYITADVINALHVEAGSVASSWVYAGAITAGQITSGTIAANRISSAIMRTSQFNADTIMAELNKSYLSLSVTCTAASFKLQNFPGQNYEINNFYILTQGSTQYYIPCHIVQN